MKGTVKRTVKRAVTTHAKYLLAALVVLGASAEATRAQTYPSKPVTFVVPFTPGGSTDILARILSQRFEQRLGKPFVVENRPGAGSVTGTLAVARSVPDGYTILMAPSPAMAINVTLHKKLPYDPAAGFVPLALVAATPFVLVVNPSLPIRSVSELIAFAKENPGQLSFGSAGTGTPHHLYAELFKSMTGIQMTHVPYRGTAPALNDIIAGHVQVLFTDIPPALGMIMEGKVRALAVSSKDRVVTVTDLPPIAEVGVPGFDAASWQMVVAPAATPRDIVDKLHVEVKSIMSQSEIKDQAVKMGMVPIDTPSVADMQSFVKTEIVRWGKVVQQAGIAGSE
jgi:tripartite-type tricarboxylate transporter receptor subunit TctC